MKTTKTHLGWWQPNGKTAVSSKETIRDAILKVNRAVTIVNRDGKYAVGQGGVALLGAAAKIKNGFSIAGYASPCPLETLGDPSFTADYGIQYPYISGAMANGIGSTEIMTAMGRAGMLGFFGAAGLPIHMVEAAIDRIEESGQQFPYGFNLIHSPNEPDLEAAVVDLYLRRDIRLVEASAYLGLTLSVVRYRLHGIHQNASGDIITPNRIIAKVSRVEVASKFFAPPPESILQQLVANGDISEEQAALAMKIPVAQDITVESDSGGHTDNQQAVTLFPTMVALRDHMQKQYNYAKPLRVGAGGGVATPMSAAAFFSMGAAYILVGTINQCSLQAGTSDIVREMLAQAQQADICMAPAADMFEMGVKVQVLKRGTMFAMRAAKLYDIYRSNESLEDIPADIRSTLEKSIFRVSLESIWGDTKTFFMERDPQQIVRAEKDAKHRMALVFRWYLGQSSRWANAGEPSRKIDYQVWCGPAMGAFNEWVRGSFLEDYKNRDVVTIALNILYGTAVLLRLNSLRQQGVLLPPALLGVAPLKPEQIKENLQ